MDELTVLVAMTAAPVGATVSEQGLRSGGPVRLGGQRDGVEASSKATHVGTVLGSQLSTGGAAERVRAAVLA